MRLINWLNQNQGFVMALLTLIYVLATMVIAWLTLRATNLSKKNLDMAIQLEKSRTRPYVLFNISSSTVRKHTFSSIKNLGLTAAYNVTISIKPTLTYDGSRESALTSQKILFLPPGEEVTDSIDSSPAFHQRYPEPVFEGAVEYEDSSANKYKEPFRIDLTFLKKRLYIREPSVADELKQVNETLAIIAKHLEQKESSNYIERGEEI